jgi:hypothetical protein
MIEKSLLKNGIIQYTYWKDDSIAPVGLLWATFTVGKGEKTIGLLLNFMVAHWFRRNGVGTELLKAMIEDCDVMISPDGSLEGGEETMKKFGFIFDDKVNMWVYTK